MQNITVKYGHSKDFHVQIRKQEVSGYTKFLEENVCCTTTKPVQKQPKECKRAYSVFTIMYCLKQLMFAFYGLKIGQTTSFLGGGGLL